jgi:hypothetical protein
MSTQRSADSSRRMPAPPRSRSQPQPSVPAAAPQATPSPAPAEPTRTVPRVRVRKRRRSRSSPAATGVSLLAIAVAAFAGWVVWRQVQLNPSPAGQQQAAGERPGLPTEVPMPPPADVEAPGNDAVAAMERPRPRPPRINRPQTEAPSESAMAATGTSPSMSSGEARTPPLPDPTPPPLPEIDPDLVAVLSAIADADYEKAEETLTTVEKQVRDTPLMPRVAAWKQLLHYARGYVDLQSEALASVTSGDEYDTPAGKIAIVESTPNSFVFRSQGRTVRRTTDAIPALVVEAIVADWLDERPANQLFVGAYHATKPQPDLDAARDAWQAAAAQGADASLLLPLLDDPLLSTP